jgi:hypothetical protein
MKSSFHSLISFFSLFCNCVLNSIPLLPSSYSGSLAFRNLTPFNESSRVESYVKTDGQSASVSWNKPPIWGLRPDFYYCQRITGLLMWRSLSDERMGLSFTIAAGSRQRSHFRVRVPWESRPYFTVSDLRLSFLSPTTTRRATVGVCDPASTKS